MIPAGVLVNENQRLLLYLLSKIKYNLKSNFVFINIMSSFLIFYICIYSKRLFIPASPVEWKEHNIDI